MLKILFRTAVVVTMSACAGSQTQVSEHSAQPAAARSNAGTDANVEAATKSASSWVTLVDAGRYADSWNAAANLFKSAVSQETWAKAAAATRAPLGKLLSRELRASDYKTAAPGAPDGKYVMIQFSTAFENRARAVETLTLMLEDDGTWKVAGYYVR